MPSPFPGMDPFLEKSPIFHELHTQMLAAAQGQLQPQLRPRYIARLERCGQEEDELLLRRQRRIVIYVNDRPRRAVTTIELLSPSNKDAGTRGQSRYLEKRASALHGGLHWVEIDLLRGGQRPPLPGDVPRQFDYLAYVAQATPTGWNQIVHPWGLHDPLPRLPLPLLGDDQVTLDLQVLFSEAYDRIAADEEADYSAAPPPPLSAENSRWVDALLKEHGLRPR